MWPFKRTAKQLDVNRLCEGNILKVWIFGEDLSQSPYFSGARVTYTPPKTLIQRADKVMNLHGALVSFVGDSYLYPVEGMPLMTDSKKVALIEEKAGSSQWRHYSGKTANSIYNVVVFFS